MKRNSLLFLAVLVSLLLVINSTKRILSLNTTSQEVTEAGSRLEKLKEENESLKQELEYKKSEQFAEQEIRNKLGLAKKGEAVVVLPKRDSEQSSVLSGKLDKPNWEKWWNLFFGG